MLGTRLKVREGAVGKVFLQEHFCYNIVLTIRQSIEPYPPCSEPCPPTLGPEPAWTHAPYAISIGFSSFCLATWFPRLGQSQLLRRWTRRDYSGQCAAP